MRRACLTVVSLLVCGVNASADEVSALRPPSPGQAQPRPHKRLQTGKHSTAERRAAVRQPAAAAADILGSGRPATTPIGTPPKVQGSWSIDPSWTASSGPTAAAYGTQGLLDELKHTPGESSGYGGGAALNLHF